MEVPPELVRILETDPDPDIALLGVDEVIDLLEMCDKFLFINERCRQEFFEVLGVSNE
jgi:hypothetical protein